MHVEWPKNRGVTRCPHCQERCTFLDPASIISWKHHPPDDPHMEFHRVTVRVCVSCGGGILHYTSPPTSGVPDGVIFPISPQRPNAPQDVRDADPGLAGEYDEAVACEPNSCQASMFILGRCVERILLDKVRVASGKPLGPMIEKAIQLRKIPDDWIDYLKDGFAIARNQAAHIWKDAAGNDMAVDAGAVEHGFTLVDWMFDYFYLAPKKRAEHVARMRTTKEKKKQGEKKT